MPLELIIRQRARIDLLGIFQFIAEDSPERALTFVESIEARCELLRDFPEQGHARDDLQPGIRILPFGRSVVVAYSIRAKTVEVERVFYGGQDFEALIGS